MTTVVAVSNPTPRAQVLGVSDVSFDECCEGRLLGGNHSSDCPRLRRLRSGQHDQMARDQEVAMAMQAWRQEAKEAHEKRTQTCRELMSRFERVQPGADDRSGVFHLDPGQQTELRPERKDRIELGKVQMRRWGTSHTMLPQYGVLHARRARTSPRTEMPRPSPHPAQTRLSKKPRSRPSSMTPRSPRKDEGRKQTEEAVRSLARTRTQSGPWRRASDRASKEIRASKTATPLREARRALEALASAALAATLRCSRSQELTTCLLRRVLAESAELEQLAEVLKNAPTNGASPSPPSLPARS
eukprot:s2639_g10.t1